MDSSLLKGFQSARGVPGALWDPKDPLGTSLGPPGTPLGTPLGPLGTSLRPPGDTLDSHTCACEYAHLCE